MPGSFRSITMCLGALLITGQAGCALAPKNGADNVATTAMAATVPASAPAAFDANPAGLVASPQNFVEMRDAESSAFVPGYSNTYIGETLGRYGLPVFAVADYYDWGGYPVYYPYPYVIGPGSSVDPWSSGYSSGSRYNGPYTAYNRGLVATAGGLDGERGIVSSKGRRVATGTRAKADDARAAQAGFAHRPEPSNGRQYRSGNPSSSKGSGRSSGSYAAGQNRGSQASPGARSSGYRGSGRGYRTRSSDMKGSYSFRRGLAGFRRTGPRP